MLTTLLNILGNKIFTNFIHTEELAYYLVLFNTATFVSGFAAMNLALAIVRLGTQHTVNENHLRERNLLMTILLSILIVFTCTMVFLFVSSYFGFILFRSDDYQFGLLIISIMGVLLLLGMFTNAYSQVLSNGLIFFLVAGFPTLIFFTISVTLVFLTNLGIYALILAKIFAGLASLIGLVLVIKKVGFGKFSVKEVIDSFKISAPGLIVIFEPLAITVDFFFPLLIYWQNPEDLTVYQYSMIVASMLMLSSIIIQASYHPNIYKLFDLKQYDTLRRVTKVSTSFFLVISIPITFFIFGCSPLLLILFYSPEYISGVDVVFLISMGNFFLLLGHFTNNGIYLTKKTHLAGIAHFLGTVVAFISGITLIPVLGIKALALSVFLRHTVTVVVMFIISQRCFKINFSFKDGISFFCSAMVWIFISLILSAFTNWPSWVVWTLPLVIYIGLILYLQLIKVEDIRFFANIFFSKSKL
jgi:O-antigen/teichoic acid export membrane protein